MEEAVRLLELARRHLEQGRVRLVLVGGLPGSGKSTLANALGDALGAIVLRSDELRSGRSRAIADPSVAADVPSGALHTSPDTRCLQPVDQCRPATPGPGQVRDSRCVVDRRVEPALAQALAVDSSADLTELHCTAPPDVTEGRIATRRQQRHGPLRGHGRHRAGHGSRRGPVAVGHRRRHGATARRGVGRGPRDRGRPGRRGAVEVLIARPRAILSGVVAHRQHIRPRECEMTRYRRAACARGLDPADTAQGTTSRSFP